MKSSRTITLFEEHSDLGRGPASFVASILIHGAVFGLISFGILYTPQIDNRAINRYLVRQLDLHTPEQQEHHSTADKVAYPGPWPKPSSGKESARTAVMPRIEHAKHGPQTLVQPDIHSDQILTQETPLPQIVIWTPSKMPVKSIVAPLPVKPAPTSVMPSLQTPNQETNLGDIAISSSTMPALNQLIVPSTTSPLVVRGPQPQPQPAPATVSQPTTTPAPAAVVSLSDIRMKDGSVALPPVNESAANDASGALSLTPAQANAAMAGNGNANPKTAGSGAGKTVGTHTGANATGAVSAQAGTGTNSPAIDPTQAQGSSAGSAAGNQASLTHITLPKDGQFGAVVIGASLEDQYPEISDVWKGRMAYTVYLHVGLEKSWILQYSLPPLADADEAGSIGHLEAPWPYNIVRPNLPADAIDADALMVHGFVNGTGRFEGLSVVFPPQFPQAQFVLDSLQQWQFRPASQNGQVAKVEVLLIIPEEFE